MRTDKKVNNNKFNAEGFNTNFKFTIILTLLFTLTVSFSSFISADVISVNSGGTGNIVLNPDKYVEGFFFGGTYCGDGVIQSPNDFGLSEQCDDGNTASGDGCSSTCQTEATGGGDTGGGGGGGGGGAITVANISVEPTEFNVNLQINTNVEKKITVTNLGTSQTTVGITQQGLTNNIILGNTTLTIPAGESRTFNVVFIALDEPGIVTGKILVGGKQILVSLNIQTELLLFDSNIVVLNPDYKVQQGKDLQTLVTLIPLGDESRLDVTLNFVIKDYSSNVYLTKSETLLVTNQVNLRRDFSTGILPLGDYIVGLELVYPNGVAPSSAHFEIVKAAPKSLFARLVLFLIIMILVILIIIMIIIIRRKLKERKEQTGSYF